MEKKLIRNYWIETYESGIILLLFNTEEKGIQYHQYDDNSYCFNVGDGFNDPDFGEEVVNIPELKIEGSYIRTSTQVKDQILFYFIPIKLVTKKFMQNE